MTLQLEVDKTYLNREGDEVKIVSRQPHVQLPFRGDDGHGYREDGGFRLHHNSGECGFDLVEVCEPDTAMELTERQKELHAYFCGSKHSPRVPLCEALVNAAKGMKLEPSETATLADIAYSDGHNTALAEMEAEIVKHFAALTVEQMARTLCGWRDGKRSAVTFDDLPEAEKAAYRDQAQAVMKLLRKE